MAINNAREARFAQGSLVLTLSIFAALFHHLGVAFYSAFKWRETTNMAEIAVFTLGIAVISYSNLVYHICLIGYYRRMMQHTPASRAEIESMYERKAPALSILIPSYKEERNVIWQTMLSAALSEYPGKNVVLLLDDPYHAKTMDDITKQDDARRIPVNLQSQFDACANLYTNEFAAFEARIAEEFNPREELNRLADYYDNVASWMVRLADEFVGDQTFETLSYSDQFFLNRIIHEPAGQHRVRAAELRDKALFFSNEDSQALLRQQYKRLIGLFTVNFSSFERKKYINLSHEANKAMNLNSYMAIIGKSWKEVETPAGIELIETVPHQADFTIPGADYIDTIDADSLMLGDYVLRMVHIMEQPENSRLAVIQSPCSPFPNSPRLMERMAGACIDVQFRTHIGYTHWDATYWVGANAMLRRTALEDIKEHKIQDGKQVTIYIQDRTLIEDTESSIDLVHKGWKLYNYPERMTFSATPPDFGSLLIQRRRWANGGLIILPKLLHYIWHAPKNLALLKESFMRFQYLVSTTACVIMALILGLYPFGESVSTAWLPLSAVPMLLLFSRDLKNTGYRYSDTLRIYAMNMMLLPVMLGGVMKQFQQMLTGKKIPFGRTPKIPGRTSVPALYCLIEIALPLCMISGMYKLALEESWSQVCFSGVNCLFLTYALLRFIGIKALIEDIVNPLKKITGQQAKILQMPAQQVNSQIAA